MILSRARRETLRLLCRGLASKEIADELEVAVSTVDNRIQAMTAAAGVNGRLQLVLWALQNDGALTREGAPPGLHPPDCLCGSAGCEAMRRRVA